MFCGLCLPREDPSRVYGVDITHMWAMQSLQIDENWFMFQ